MSQQSIFISDGGGSNNNANVAAQNGADGGFSLQGLVAQYNASTVTLTDTHLSFLQVDVNGALKVSNTAAATNVANPGSPLPTQTTWIGASDGTDLRGLLVESSTAANLRTSLYYGATEMIIFNDGYTGVHQIGTWNVGVTGTVAVTQSTSPWVVSGTVTANAGTGTFDVNVTNASLAVTQSGTWTVNQGGAPWTVTGTYASNVAAGSDAVKGLVGRYQSSPTAITDGNLTYLQTDAYGKLLTTATLSPSFVAAPNTALPADTAWMGASDGTNLQGLMVDNSTNKNLKVALFSGANELAIDGSGRIGVTQGTSPWVVSGTVAVSSVSGTVAVTQSTSPWIVAGQYAANVAAGSDAEKALTAQFHATGSASAVAGPVDGYRFAGTTVTDGNVTYAQTDGYGRLEVAGARAVAYAYENRTSQTVTLKSTAGVLRKVIVGNAGATGALVTFYDNTAGAGTVIAKLNTSNVLGQIVFDIPFAVGLTYTTTTRAPGDVTITFE